MSHWKTSGGLCTAVEAASHTVGVTDLKITVGRRNLQNLQNLRMASRPRMDSIIEDGMLGSVPSVSDSRIGIGSSFARSVSRQATIVETLDEYYFRCK